MVQKLYPGGKNRAFNVSYDDGVEQDVKFIALLDRYGLKGTFNINYGMTRQRFQWVHESGLVVKRLPEDVVKEVYRGHEVASHSFSHPYMDHFTEDEILKEMGADRFFLQRLFGREITGYATPFYFFSEEMARCARECGFSYARISEESNDYSIPEDFYLWRGSKFHWDADLEEFVDGFLSSQQELALCQLVGHSYDLDVYDMWQRMERILSKVGRCGDVWPATHGELVSYLNAMKQAVITDNSVSNYSPEPLWFRINGKTHMLNPGEVRQF